MKKGYFILGFFPAAILFFIGIFTSMAWNMAFGVYESLTGVPKLVYNSIVSWSWKLFDRIHVFGR